MKKRRAITHGSLFSGLGGFDLAAASVGWKNAFHCEINPFCTRVLNYWFPEAEHYEDITKTDFTRWRGRIDVLSGGFPCQPFSLAGQRKGAEDDRYLWPQMLRAIREIRPSWVVGENVAGILTMVQPGEALEVAGEPSLFGEGNRKRVLLSQEYVIETICRDLEREGYSVQPLVIPACAVGAPHRRDRVWFVSHRDGDRCRLREDKQNPDTGRSSTTDNSNGGTNGHSANTTCEQGKRHRLEQSGSYKQEQGKLGRGDSEAGTERYDTNPYGTSIQRGYDITPQEWEIKGKRSVGQLHCIPNWDLFPTQSPICSRNDELSDRLDGITFPRWRRESLKAYGNAVVPALVREIFMGIEQQLNTNR